MSFTEPRFLDRNLAAGFDLFHKDVNLSTANAFRTRTTGGSVRLGFPIMENLWLTNSYTLTVSSIYDVQEGASRAIKEAAGDAITSAWGVSLGYDARNHPKNPTSGYFSRPMWSSRASAATCSIGGLGAEGRYYYPITEKITFVARAMGGHIGPGAATTSA